MVGQIHRKTVESTNSKKMGGVFMKTDDDSILHDLQKTFGNKLTVSQIQNLFKYFQARPEKYSFASLHYKFDGDTLYMLCQIENKLVGGRMTWEEVMEEIDISTL